MKRQGFFPPSQHAKTHANRGKKRENRRIIIQNDKKYTGYCHVLCNIPHKWCGRQELKRRESGENDGKIRENGQFLPVFRLCPHSVPGGNIASISGGRPGVRFLVTIAGDAGGQKAGVRTLRAMPHRQKVAFRQSRQEQRLRPLKFPRVLL